MSDGINITVHNITYDYGEEDPSVTLTFNPNATGLCINVSTIWTIIINPPPRPIIECDEVTIDLFDEETGKLFNSN